jgi:D-alanyl-D-alanine carboxypeptidase/D-alanyl-D-alanine-endopeptidase (penicillin-binding protein 4)
MHDSDNFTAESLILSTSKYFNQHDSLSRKYQIQYLKDSVFTFIDNDIKWVDGSGLSRYNLITPKNIVQVLIQIRKESLEEIGSMNHVFNLFANGGSQGTLKNRFTDMEGYIFAKTGSLSNNNNISGYLVTKSNKILLFSIMVNHYMERTSLIQQQSDNLLRDFHLYYK